MASTALRAQGRQVTGQKLHCAKPNGARVSSSCGGRPCWHPTVDGHAKCSQLLQRCGLRQNWLCRCAEGNGENMIIMSFGTR